MLDLSGSRAKIERAKKHIRDFDGERISFLDTNPYVTVPKFQPESNVTQILLGPLPVIPSGLAVIVGDAAQNLRSALDYVAAELVRSQGGNPKKVYFPIAESAEKYKSESPGKTKGLRPEAKKFIDQMEPYGGGYMEPLWILHSLNNADKHRLLITIGANIGETIQIELKPELTEYTFLFRAPGLKEGNILGQLPGNSEAEHRIKFTFEIAFGEPDAIAGEPVVPILTKMTEIVEAIVTHFETNF